MLEAKGESEEIISYKFEIGGYATEAIIDAMPCSNRPKGDKVFNEVRRQFGENAFFHSCIKNPSDEAQFRKFLEGKKIDTIVELGTYKGISTIVLAQYANKVITLDNVLVLSRMPVWGWFGVNKRIETHRVNSNWEKLQLLKRLDFDYAFIDDQHDYEGARIGFEATKECGRVLFHDYSNSFPGVKKFVDELPREELTISVPFAYWEKRNAIQTD